MAEICLTTASVGERSIVHHLQEEIENIWVRLLDFVQEQHTVWRSAHRICQQSTIFISHISRRGTDESCHRVFLCIFAHVEAQQFHTHFFCQHLRHFRLTHTSGSHKQERSHGFTFVRESSTRQKHSLCHRCYRLILTEDLSFHRRFERLQICHFACFHIAQALHFADASQHLVDECLAHHLILGGMHLTISSSLVDEVNRFVRQASIIDESSGTMHRMAHRIGRKRDVVERFVARLQTFEDAHRLFYRGFGHFDGLKTSHQSPMSRNVAVEFFVSGGSHKSDAAFFQERFEHIGSIHCPIACASSANDVVNLVDIHNRVGNGEQAFHDQLPAFLKIATILRTCQERTHIEGEYLSIFQAFGHVTHFDSFCQSIDERSLTHSRVAHVEGIVLVATAEHTNRAFQFVLATDEGIASFQMIIHTRHPLSPILRFFLGTLSRCSTLLTSISSQLTEVFPQLFSETKHLFSRLHKLLITVHRFTIIGIVSTKGIEIS